MSSVIIAGDTSGTVTLQAPAVAGSTTLTLPSTSGTLSTYTGFSTVVFASSGSWTVPAGVTQARITVVGGGGPGRSTATASLGGAGGFAVAYCTGISGTLTITVGAGQAGNSGIAGGTSSITGTGVSISATGGGPGLSGASGVDGGATVTTGTQLRAGSSGYGTQLLSAGASTNTLLLGSSAQVWSTSSLLSAGAQGISSASASGSVSGAVIIEY